MSYELAIILRGEEALKPVKELLEKNKIKIISEDIWGMRRLAYEIIKVKEGFYGFLKIEATSAELATLTKKLKMDSNVLRVLATKV